MRGPEPGPLDFLFFLLFRGNMSFKGHREQRRTLGELMVILAALFTVLLLTMSSPPIQDVHKVPSERLFIPFENYNGSIQMKDPIVGYIRAVIADHYLIKDLNDTWGLDVAGDWGIVITHYHNGAVKGTGTGSGAVLSDVLRSSVIASLDPDMDYFELNYSRFKVQFERPFHYSFVEFRGEAVETIGDMVPLWCMDKAMVNDGIEGAKEYLLRVIDPEVQGAHKYYYALDDTFENRIHCIYTASLVFSLIRIYDFDKDERLWTHIDNCSEFLLSMQNMEKGKAKGAFYYSYYPDDDTKEEKYVVGTTSKTIFTLIMLYEHTGDQKYLSAARSAADWLLTMQRDDGSMKSYIRREAGVWFSSTEFSYLFNGQVLSALSRMYILTKDQDYYDAAQRIAGLFVDNVNEHGYYLGDDYRSPNPVSSSWVILSLFDFYKASGEQKYLDIVLSSSASLLKRQFTNSSNVITYGRFDASETSSGNGWLCEVFVEIFRYLHEIGVGGLDDYQDAITMVTRWILQNTYTLENSYMIKNPYMAQGGAFWDPSSRYIRTDAVCHAVNGLVRMYEYYGNGTLISVTPDPNPLLDIIPGYDTMATAQ